MTAHRTSGATPPDQKEKAASDRETRGSVTEAIGKLIGDDAVRERGTAEKRAGADAAPTKPESPDR